MTLITYEFHRVRPKLFMSLWYVQCNRDEDINTTPTPSLAPLGPLTRARARQLNHQVS
jgi:hypothetical protein